MPGRKNVELKKDDLTSKDYIPFLGVGGMPWAGIPVSVPWVVLIALVELITSVEETESQKMKRIHYYFTA